MSYAPPPGNAADFSWQDQQLYSEPAGDAADFSWQGGTQAPTTVLAAGNVVAPPPTPLSVLSASAEASKLVAATATVQAPAPAPATTPAAALRLVQQAGGVVAAAPPDLSAQPVARVSLDLALGDNAHTGAMAAHGALDGAAATGARAPIAQMAPTRTAARGGHTHGLLRAGSRRIAHTDSDRLRRSARAQHAYAARVSASAASGHKNAVRVQRPSRVPHATMPPTIRGTSVGHAEYIRTTNRQHIQQQQMLPAPALGLWLVVKQGGKMGLRLLAGQQQAMWPLAGRWSPGYEPPGLVLSLVCEGGYRPRDLRCTVVLSPTGVQPPCNPDQPEPETIIVPVRRAYIVLNTITLARASDGAPIDATALTIGFDCDSWLPTFSATVPENMRQLVMPGAAPVEVVATVNGTPFHFLVETIQRVRRGISERAVSIGGRGVACELGAPYAPTANYAPAQARTAQQLVDDALQFTGYTQTWGLVDWLVPGGVFSLTGTPADVAAAVANAAGGVLAAHWSQRNLRMLPRYPVKPWDWPAATPDIVIPSAAVQSEGVEWQEMPDYDVVYVSGTVAGVTGQVKRAGTAGGKPAPMVADQLITHADAARQRGTTILSNTGRKAALQISLPVLPETGVIDLCKLVEFTDGSEARRGIVRANQISVAWPSVRQTLTIEAQA